MSSPRSPVDSLGRALNASDGNDSNNDKPSEARQAQFAMEYGRSSTLSAAVSQRKAKVHPTPVPNNCDSSPSGAIDSVQYYARGSTLSVAAENAQREKHGHHLEYSRGSTLTAAVVAAQGRSPNQQDGNSEAGESQRKRSEAVNNALHLAAEGAQAVVMNSASETKPGPGQTDVTTVDPSMGLESELLLKKMFKQDLKRPGLVHQGSYRWIMQCTQQPWEKEIRQDITLGKQKLSKKVYTNDLPAGNRPPLCNSMDSLPASPSSPGNNKALIDKLSMGDVVMAAVGHDAEVQAREQAMRPSQVHVIKRLGRSHVDLIDGVVVFNASRMWRKAIRKVAIMSAFVRYVQNRIVERRIEKLEKGRRTGIWKLRGRASVMTQQAKIDSLVEDRIGETIEQSIRSTEWSLASVLDYEIDQAKQEHHNRFLIFPQVLILLFCFELCCISCRASWLLTATLFSVQTFAVQVWDLFIVGLIVWNASYYPYVWAFEKDKVTANSPMTTVIDLAFIVDLAMNFLRAYRGHEGNVFLLLLLLLLAVLLLLLLLLLSSLTQPHPNR